MQGGHAAARLRGELQALYDLVEEAPDAVLMVDAGTVIYVNHACMSLFGADKQTDLVGLPVETLVSPRDRAREWARRRHLNVDASRPEDCILTVLLPDGTEIEVVVRLRAVRHRGRILAQLILRHRAEIENSHRDAALAAERYHRLFHLADSARVQLSGLTIVDANPAAGALFAASSALELRGRELHELVAPADRLRLFGMLDAALHDVAVTTPVDLNLAARGANATVRVHAMRENCPEGVRLLVALRALAPGDPPGTSTAPGRSAAHIGHLEAELARARGDLEEQLLLRTEDLRAFNYSVSHDLRGPVRAITGFANFLREDIGADDLAAAAHTAARIAAAGERLDEMLEKLLQFSMRAEAALNLQAVAQEELVREVIDQLPDHHAGISIGKLPAATCDRILIGEVWTNLISNAIKYSARETSPVIGIGHADGAYFVRDNGVGFDMGDYRRLFGLFNRLHADQEFCGTGAGLAIARRIVAHHGGTMWATSEPGRGATFCFTLGAAQQATANPATIP